MLIFVKKNSTYFTVFLIIEKFILFNLIMSLRNDDLGHVVFVSLFPMYGRVGVIILLGLNFKLDFTYANQFHTNFQSIFDLKSELNLCTIASFIFILSNKSSFQVL